MMPFFNRTRLERVGVVEPELGLLWTDAEGSWIVGDEVGLLQCWSAGSGRGTPLQKQERRKNGRQGLRPWPLRCLSQFLSEKKDRLLRGRMCCVCLCMSLRTFHRWGGLVFIMDDHDNFSNWIMILNSMFPNWMMTPNSMFPSRRMI